MIPLCQGSTLDTIMKQMRLVRFDGDTLPEYKWRKARANQQQ